MQIIVGMITRTVNDNFVGMKIFNRHKHNWTKWVGGNRKTEKYKMVLDTNYAGHPTWTEDAEREYIEQLRHCKECNELEARREYL